MRGDEDMNGSTTIILMSEDEIIILRVCVRKRIAEIQKNIDEYVELGLQESETFIYWEQAFEKSTNLLNRLHI